MQTIDKKLEQEEINYCQLMYEKDRPRFIPRRSLSLTSVPTYENAVKESSSHYLNLYLWHGTQKKRINIDCEYLKSKPPSRKDLKSYPVICHLKHKSHKGDYANFY